MLAWDKLDEGDIVDVDDINSNDIVDLLARVMVNGLKYLIKRGFDRQYISINEEESTIKGKINFSDSIKRTSWINGKLFCEYDELNHNILHNQIIKTTIGYLIKNKELNSELKNNLFSLYKYFRDIDEIKLTEKTFNLVRLNKNNHYYAFLLNICEVIFKNLLIDKTNGNIVFKDFQRDEKQMAYLFEYFVRNFYKRELKDAKVYRENINWCIDNENTLHQQYLPVMQTDISIELDNKKIIIDTKYYKDAFSYSFNAKKLHSNNLYQLFSYLINVEAKGVSNQGCAGILLYPMTAEELNLDYTIQGHKVKIKTVNLNQDWELIHERLLDIVLND